MLDDHEVKEIKDVMLDVMLTGSSERYYLRGTNAWKLGFIMIHNGEWEISDKGRAWLDEQRTR